VTTIRPLVNYSTGKNYTLDLSLLLPALKTSIVLFYLVDTQYIHSKLLKRSNVGRLGFDLFASLQRSALKTMLFHNVQDSEVRIACPTPDLIQELVILLDDEENQQGKLTQQMTVCLDQLPLLARQIH